MRDIFLRHAERGAMTLRELAEILRRSQDWVRTHSKGPDALIPRIPGKPIRFDPLRMIEVFCPESKARKPRSLTILPTPAFANNESRFSGRRSVKKEDLWQDE